MGESFEPAVRRKQSYSTRCPFCHDDLPGGGVECGVCGARHHTFCIDEAPTCATCGEDLGDKVHRALLREAALRDAWWVRWFPSRRYHDEWQRWRQWAYRPMILLVAAAVGGLTIALELLHRNGYL